MKLIAHSLHSANKMNYTETLLYKTGIVPVIKIADSSQASLLSTALHEGGIFAAEVTFRTDAAAESIFKMREACPDMLIGAGTVLTVDCLNDAILAGAGFIVSPGLNPRVVEAALEKNIPVIPGCMTPTEIETAMSFGLDFVKFFPAEAAGGVKMLKAMSAPYSGMRFMPTGGITLANAAEYLSLKSVVCCGGSFIAEEKDIAEGKFDKIREKAAEVTQKLSLLRKF